ncbi:serine hydrolase domain-containing protein [Desulfonatronum thioautotrophicum]|uniref:serine hydrolase domain-containing protein n=1 Tax=Desulfonatronum thioautotrophicum TaxID=617001 RepID=UPI000A048E27|nr:serine hydrolase domain-containing protein [Desulfonatronum thioautotrophicum]
MLHHAHCSRLLLLGLCWLWLFCLAAPGMAREGFLEPEELEITMFRLMDKWQVHGVAVALIDSGEVVWEEGYGWADMDAWLPALPDTVFQAASISKAVSAAVALRLVQDGLLDLDEPVSGYLTRWQLPESEFDPDGVTLRRILSHTAGLSVPGYMGFLPDHPAQTLEDSLTSATDADDRGVAVILPPGEQWVYSGGGYTLMQLMVEEVTGRAFAQVASDLVLNPLKMKRSSFGDDSRLHGHQARSYTADNRDVPQRHFTALAAAGLWATAGDLARFAVALAENAAGEGGQLELRPELVQEIFSPQPGTESDLFFAGSRWGLGLGLLDLPDGQGLLAFHPGTNPPAWHSLLAILPGSTSEGSQTRGFIILTNGEHGGELVHDAMCLWMEAVGVQGITECVGRRP